MIALRRIIIHGVVQTDNWDEHVLRLSTQSIEMSDEDFEKLKLISQKNRYDYIDDNNKNIICLDIHPDIIKEKIKNKDFINDYKDNINKKFFISYWICD